MKKKIFIFFIINIFLLSDLSVIKVHAARQASYEVFIKTYQRNSIIVEFPQIRGMSDLDKQNEINYLLEREIFQYITDCYNDLWLDNGQKVVNILRTISETKDATLEFICHTGLESDTLLSIRYAVYGYGHGGAHPNTWGYAYTVDLDRALVLGISDLLKIDNSLLDLEGMLIFDRDFDDTPYEYHIKLYDSLDSYKLYTKSEILELLKEENYKSCYITKDRGISFFFGVQNHEHEIEIGFEDIKDHIEPLYCEKLLN